MKSTGPEKGRGTTPESRKKKGCHQAITNTSENSRTSPREKEKLSVKEEV